MPGTSVNMAAGRNVAHEHGTRFVPSRPGEACDTVQFEFDTHQKIVRTALLRELLDPGTVAELGGHNGHNPS